MKKALIIISVLVLVILLACFGAYKLAPGSYPFAEIYKIHTDEATLISAINQFKKENPQYQVPSETHLVDARSNEQYLDHWYHVYFYYPDENQIVHAWTEPNFDKGTDFALIGVGRSMRYEDYKEINHTMSRAENRDQKRKFEERILKPVKQLLASPTAASTH